MVIGQRTQPNDLFKQTQFTEIRFFSFASSAQVKQKKRGIFIQDHAVKIPPEIHGDTLIPLLPETADDEWLENGNGTASVNSLK
jgi:hypothetical protein